MKVLRNAAMDAASALLYRLSPGRAGAFDAWCDRWRWS